MRLFVGRQLSLWVCALGTIVASSLEAKDPRLVDLRTLSFSGSRASAKDSGGVSRVLGLDAELQAATQRVLEQARAVAGAAVLVDVRTGQVLAAAETGVDTPGELLLSPSAPSASVFKIVTTAALYERGGVGPQDRICTRGGLRSIDAAHLEPARGPGTVCTPFQEALAVSRNAAYAQLSTGRLQRLDLLEVAESFGFNRSLPLDARGQVGVLEVPFNDLEFARTAAGFQNSKLSVFGATQLALTIASLGAPPPMHLGESSEHAEPPLRIIRPSTARRIRRSMELTVQSGTAHDAFVDEHGRNYLGYIQAAGKTGTLKPRGQESTSSWFIGFAPSQEPTIAVGLLLQISDRWHRKAATSARDLLRYYFARRGAKAVTPPFELREFAQAPTATARTPEPRDARPEEPSTGEVDESPSESRGPP